MTLDEARRRLALAHQRVDRCWRAYWLGGGPARLARLRAAVHSRSARLHELWAAEKVSLDAPVEADSLTLMGVRRAEALEQDL